LTRSYDIAITGSGFSGSLVAMIARRLGYSVALLERGRHPRVVIGESSTPLANLVFEELCRKYDLTAIAPLAKWGSWQRRYPNIACGLKRGFTFYHHRLDDPVDTSTGDENWLLVAASPHDAIADTHWFRADFDQFLMEQAQQAGADYFDEVRVDAVACEASSIEVRGTRKDQDLSLRARFLIDASGPRGLLHHALKIGESTLANYPSTQALYSHFSGVTRPVDSRLAEAAPYPPEAAAVHHVFEGGWMWVLHFNNGITSAGLAATDALASTLRLAEGAGAWERLLTRIPSVQQQFAHSQALQPFRRIPQLSFLSRRVWGPRWALLPSAAGFVDPLLSTGFALTLLGVERLARVLESDPDSPGAARDLQAYENKTREELEATARLIASLYANMQNFPLFRALCLVYFAAASFSETARRLGKAYLAPSFLLYDHPGFSVPIRAILDRAVAVPRGPAAKGLIDELLKTIEPIDVAGLSKPNPRHLYPVDARDLVAACGKVGATEHEVEALLARCGFYQTQQG
jgi:tetracycline 7-halogenase / FADH2 O2-dependent halogenase